MDKCFVFISTCIIIIFSLFTIALSGIAYDMKAVYYLPYVLTA